MKVEVKEFSVLNGFIYFLNSMTDSLMALAVTSLVFFVIAGIILKGIDNSLFGLLEAIKLQQPEAYGFCISILIAAALFRGAYHVIVLPTTMYGKEIKITRTKPYMFYRKAKK